VSAPVTSINGYRESFQRFVDDASFLWVLRSIAIKQAGYESSDIQDLDERIDALLDVLILVPDESWALCKESAAIGQAGEIFTTAIIAFRSLDVAKIQFAVDTALAADNAINGLASALAWLPGRLVHSWIKKFLNSKDLNHKYLALIALSLRREDPREYLSVICNREDCIAHALLYSRALRLIGELKRFDLVDVLRTAMNSDVASVKFWAHWSNILLGDYSSAEKLYPYIKTKNPLQEKAIEIAFNVLNIDQAKEWIVQLAKEPKQIRAAIKASSVLGDPQVIPWLITQMRIPELSRVAGEAFTIITGVDLEKNNVALVDLPELDEQFQGEEDNNVDLDEDLYLPFPDADRVAAVWQKYQNRFISGKRYFFGKPQEEEFIAHLLAMGDQRLRRKAAIKLALIRQGSFLMNTAGWRGSSE